MSWCMAALAALLVCGAWAGASHAGVTGYGFVQQMSGHYMHGTLGPTRDAVIPIPSGATNVELEVTATLGTSGSSNDGSKIKWDVNIPSGATGTATATIVSPGSGSGTTATDAVTGADPKAKFRFTNAGPASKFQITAQLQNDGGSNVGTPGLVNVQFVQAVDMTGGTMSRAAATVREQGTLVIQATPIPSNASIKRFEWRSRDGTRVSVEPVDLSPHLGEVTGVAHTEGGPVQVECVMTDESNNSVTVSCDITVVKGGTIADDMVISGDSVVGGGDSSDAGGATIYGTNTGFYTNSDSPYAAWDLTDAKIQSAANVENGKMHFIVGKPGEHENVTVNVKRSDLTGPAGLNIADYTTHVVSAMRISADITGKTSGETGMVPFMLQYNFPAGMRYPDRATVVDRPTSAADFHDKFVIKKYFDKDSAPVDISALLHGSMNAGQYMQNDESTGAGSFRVGPMIVIVDALAPKGSAAQGIVYRGEGDKYGVRYDKGTNILFIYDGDPDDGRASDPIVLEKRREVRSGGGGGGCAAGAAGAAIAALAVLIRRNR